LFPSTSSYAAAIGWAGTQVSDIGSFLFSRSKYTYKFKQDANTPGLVFWKPTTPGQRHKITIDYDNLGVYTGPPLKDLSFTGSNSGGRNNTGRITVRGRGGGMKKLVRVVDFDRSDMEGVPGVVERIELDPFRTGFLALTRYEPAGQLPVYRYHIAPEGIKVGDTLHSGPGSPVTTGSVLRLADIPPGVPIHNVELTPGSGAKLARAAHTAAYVQLKQEDAAVVKLPSGELRKFKLTCRATIGTVSNPLHKLTNLGKAGANRLRGRRPITRGIARNPVDHPHGGRTNGGRPSCTPWGVYCKGKRTRRRNKFSNQFILVRKGGQPIDKFVNAKKPKAASAAGSGGGKQAAAGGKA